MQVNNLIRLLNSSRLCISSRTSLPSYQLIAGVHSSAETGSKHFEKPKRPINAYLRYLKSVRPTILAQNPKASPAEIARQAASQWHILDPAAKSKLEDEYKKEQAIWLQENAKYLSQLTEEQKDEIHQARIEKAEEKVKRDYRKKLKGLGRPKRPLNGFFLFCADVKPTSLNKEENRMQIKLMAEKWSQMSEAEKAPYKSRAAEGLVKYREEMKQWEEKMIAEDHLDVVRRRSIILPPKKEIKPRSQ